MGTLAGCIAGCKADKKKGCTIAEYSTGKTCCTSAYATKKGCPGSFTSSGSWKGYNIKCFGSTLANCIATCKKTPGCTIAEYSTGKTCCTSKYATKKTCPGSFTSSSSWKGYVVCGA